MRYKYSDLSTDEHGELLLSSDDVDMYRIANSSATIQMIEHRFKTMQGDLYCHPLLGLGLQDITGRRMTPQVINIGKASIIQTLSYDGFINLIDISVNAIPTSVESVIYHVSVDLGNEQRYVSDFVFDINKGIRRTTS